MRAARSLGVAASDQRNLPLKQRRRGLDEASYIESFLVLNAVGGECLDDFAVLREDLGMAERLGYEPPSPEAARQFLYQFHDDEKILAAQQQQPGMGPAPASSPAKATHSPDWPPSTAMGSANSECAAPIRKLPRWMSTRRSSNRTSAKHSRPTKAPAAGVLPCGRFGANAAWLRLSALTDNVLTAMKRLALPPELLRARPKRLRFLVFVQPGKLVRHARQLTLRLMRAWRHFSNWAWAFEQLPLAAPS